MPDSDALAPVPLDVSERDRDLMARTIYGEANGLSPRAQAAVGQVIVNRALGDGFPGSVGEVVLQRGQFEPWATRRGELQGLSPNSKAYREARQTVDDVLGGTVPDMTNGATHFYAPKAQAAFGRAPPSWAREPLASEGGHVFYAPNGPVDRTAIGMPPGAGPTSWTTLDGAGIAPRPTSPQPDPRAATMPKETAAADDVMAIYGLSPNATPAAPVAPARPAARPAGKAQPASPAQAGDDLLALYGLSGASAPAGAQAVPVAATVTAGQADPAMPLASPEGIRDGNTGALVVGGKPFTDNRSGLWSGFENLANGALLGAGVPLAAGVAALKEKALHSGDLSNLYAQARSAYGGARDDYRTANPGTALATELAGSIPTTIAATAAGGAALGGVGNALMDAAGGAQALPILARAGQFVTGAAGRAVPASAAGPAQAGNLLTRALSQGAAGAGAGAFGGAINTGLTGGDVTGNALTGGVLGAGVGAALPAAGAAISGTFNRLTGSTTPEVAALARTARDTYGIPIRAGQISDSPAVRFMDSTLSRTPGMGYGAANAGQQTAVNRAVAQTFGETADKITPAVMQTAKTRLGQSFDKVAAGSWVRNDNHFSGDLGTIFKDAAEALPQSELEPLQKLVRNGILPKFDPLTQEMEGSAYQALTRKGTPLDRMMSAGSPNVRFYASRIRNALDDALERSAPPELVDELRQARSQYRSMKTIEDLAAKSPTGDISPAALMQAVQRNSGPRAAYTGGGDLGELARIGQRFLKEPPSSGTAERLAAKDTLTKLTQAGQMAGGAAGAAMGLNHFAPQLANLAPGVAGPAIASAAAGFGVGRLASSVLRSEGLSNRLIDRALGTGHVGPVNRLLSMVGGVAPETVAPAYNHGPTNDNAPANRLAEFLQGRTPQRAGMLP